MKRRQLLPMLAGSAAVLGSSGKSEAQEPKAASVQTTGPRTLPIGISTYSFWRFKNEDYRPVERCLELASELGFDGVEILQRQLVSTSPELLRDIKRRAFVLGMPLMGYSTHQGFLSPEEGKRNRNIQQTTNFLEEAYRLGIPTIRVNTGSWGTSKDFNELMKNRGIEPPLEGYTDEEGFKWVIDSFEKLIPEAEKRGVIMGLENHWGLGRTPEGVLRVVDAVKSPWLQVTLDTGNFLEDPYDRLALLASKTVLLQTKTYYGGGEWYTLDLDYQRIAGIMKTANYKGWVSIEFEGKDNVLEGAKNSLSLMRQHFTV